MQDIFFRHLFKRHIFVCKEPTDRKQAFETIFSLAGLFDIYIAKGKELAVPGMIRQAANYLDRSVVNKDYYRNLPEAAWNLAWDEQLYDKLMSYFMTCDPENFDLPHRMVMRDQFNNYSYYDFAEAETTDYIILSEADAEKELRMIVDRLLAESLRLDREEYALVKKYCKVYSYLPEKIASKTTAVRLLYDLQDDRFVKFLMLSDVIKLLDEVNYHYYQNKNLKKLNLKNRDRKFLTAVINDLFRLGRCDSEVCCEKKDIWRGLLYHLHYKPVNEQAEAFAALMNGKKNISARSLFEAAMKEGDTLRAMSVLQKMKGSEAVCQNIDYILSRSTEPVMEEIIAALPGDDPLLLIRLLFFYAKDAKKVTRFQVLASWKAYVPSREVLEISPSENVPSARKQKKGRGSDPKQALCRSGGTFRQSIYRSPVETDRDPGNRFNDRIRGHSHRQSFADPGGRGEKGPLLHVLGTGE